jgi:hypothetical protein
MFVSSRWVSGKKFKGVFISLELWDSVELARTNQGGTNHWNKSWNKSNHGTNLEQITEQSKANKANLREYFSGAAFFMPVRGRREMKRHLHHGAS